MGAHPFDFGGNWKRFLEHHLDDQRIAAARESLCDLLGLATLAGRTFCDAGCGSGLFSLAAFQAGAARVVSFDPDPQAVACCRTLAARVGSPAAWQIRPGSLLDPGLTDALGTFDLVYCYGVAHHTGDVWRALDRAAALVGENGSLGLGVYNRVTEFGFFPDGRFGTSRFWSWEKRIFSGLPRFLQQAVAGGAMGAVAAGYLLTGHDPRRKVREFSAANRGMAWQTDIIDWLGGYPYQPATADEVVRFLQPRGLILDKLAPDPGLGNNEYLFHRERKPARE